MRHLVIAVSLLLLIMGSTAWWLYGTHSVQDRALKAYNEGRFEEALPLMKQWAALPEVRTQPDALKIAVAYITVTEQRIQEMKAGGAPATVMPQNTSAVMAQAGTLANMATGSDPSTGVNRIPHKPPVPGETLTMTIKELGNFEFNPETDADVPADVQALDGTKVRLNGFMWPLDQTEKVSHFALVPTLGSCCFGQPPGVQHIVDSRTPANQGVEYTTDEVVVEGTIHIHVQRKENFTFSIFDLDVTSVKVRE